MTFENARIQTLRGLACLLIVIFHVMGNRPDSGLHIGDDSVWRQLSNLLSHTRLPLFSFLSGFVYAYRPAAGNPIEMFFRKKLMRLLLPLLFVSTLYFFVAKAAPEATGALPFSEMWRIYVFPYVHFWFLQALILVLLGVAVLESVGAMSTARRYAIVLAASMVLHLFGTLDEATAPFSVLQAAYLAVFFLIGLGANRFRTVFERPAVLWVCIVGFVVGMSVHAAGIFLYHHPVARGTVVGLALGISTTLLLLRWFPPSRLLAAFGAYAFAIYLFHPFFIGAARTAMKMAGITSMLALFVSLVIIGAVGPVLMERVLGGIPVISQLLFGQPPARRKPATATPAVNISPVVSERSPVTRP